MKVSPFVVRGFNQHNTAMGTNFHLSPNTHALYFGPIECARHSFPGLAADPKGSMLVITDVQTSLGLVESLIRDAVKDICDRNPETRAVMLCTACQTAFTGIDLEGLCLDLHEETGLCFGYVVANRMSTDNIPGRARKNIPGGDRYHTRLATFRMLKQIERRQGHSSGVLVLTEDGLDKQCDLLELTQLDGIDWVRGVGDFESFEDFEECRNARFAIATSMPWKETADYLENALDIPALYLPTSYSLDEIDKYYRKLIAQIRESVPEAREKDFDSLKSRVAKRRNESREAIDSLLASRMTRSLELDIRLIARPFSLVEALMGYGFSIRSFTPSPMRIQHKESDDVAAFERLARQYPAIGQRYKERPKSKDRTGPTSTRHRAAAGRFIEIDKRDKVERVPEETAWWGYSSVLKLMEEIRAAHAKTPSYEHRGTHTRKKDGEKWSL